MLSKPLKDWAKIVIIEPLTEARLASGQMVDSVRGFRASAEGFLDASGAEPLLQPANMSRLRDGDVVVKYADGSLQALVVTGVGDREVCISGSRLALVRCQDAETQPEYLALVIRSRDFLRRFEGLSSSGGMFGGHLLKNIGKIDVIVPTQKRQAALVGLDAKTSELKALHERQGVLLGKVLEYAIGEVRVDYEVMTGVRPPKAKPEGKSPETEVLATPAPINVPGAQVIEIDGGKCAVVLHEDGRMESHGDGESPRDLTGDKLFCALVERIRNMEQELAALRGTEQTKKNNNEDLTP